MRDLNGRRAAPEPPPLAAPEGVEPGEGEGEGGGEAAAPRRLRVPWPQLVALLGFLTLAVLLLGATWTSPTDRTLGGGLGDPGVFLWFLRWTPFAVGRHVSPFFSDYLNHPAGVNLMWNTWLPLPGLLLSPLTLTFGPVLTLNVLLTLAYGLSSWSAYLAIRRYVPNHLAAAVGGLVYGFSFAMRGHSHHPNLILVFLLPWLLVLVDEVLVRQRHSPLWLGLALGGLAAAQALVGEEMLAATALVGALVMLALVLSHPRAALRRAPRALAALAVGLLVAVALLAWPLKAQLTGPARVHGDITAEERGSSDLLGLVTPNPLLAIDPPAANRLRARFTGSNETYLGVPLLLVVVAVAVARPGSTLVRVAFAVLLALVVLSLGAELRVGGHRTGVWLPWAAVEPVPLIKNLVPARLSVLTSLFAGLLLAVALDGLWSLRRWWWRMLAVAVAAAVLAFLAPPKPFPAPKVVATPPFFTTAVRTLPRDTVALLLPFPRKGRQNVPMVWQAEAGMWFKMPGGYFVGPDPGGGARHDALPTTATKALVQAQVGRPPKLTPALRAAIAKDFATWRVGAVVVGPTPNRRAVVGFITELLGRPPQQVGGVQLWRGASVAGPRSRAGRAPGTSTTS